MSQTRNTPIFPIAILILIFAAFLAWLFLRGQSHSSQPPSTPTLAPDTGFVVNIPQKALMKNYVTVSAEAISGTKCELTYIPPSGDIHQTDAIAGTSGLCVWKWKVEESEGKGNGRLIFTIGDISETHFIEIRSGF
jgi:hypothetical protein